MLENSPNLWQNMSLYLIDPITITCWINFDARKSTKFMANVRYFFQLYTNMIFKNGKRFRFAPLFNKELSWLCWIRVSNTFNSSALCKWTTWTRGDYWCWYDCFYTSNWLSWLFNYWKASDVFVNICDNCMSLTRTVAPAPNFMYRTDVKYSDANTNFSADGIDLLRAVGIRKS